MSDRGVAVSDDGGNETFEDIVTIDVGSLAVIVLVVVSICFVLIIVSMCCWHRWSSSSLLRCDRCHNVVAYQGVRLPHLPAHHQQPQYNVVVHPQQQLHQSQQPGHSSHHHQATASLMGLPGSRHQLQLRQARAHQYQNIPAIVVSHQPDPVNNVQAGDSATFQRLGMRDEAEASQSLVSQDARALESRAMVHQSPPDNDTGGLEPLTPSPVSTITADQSSVQEGVTRDGVQLNMVTPGPRGKMDQVRILDYPPHQTPATKTPGRALLGNMKSLARGSKTVRMVEPVKVPDRHPGEQYPMLEISELDQTAVTTGDLHNLLDTDQTVETSMILDRNYSNSSESKTITPGSNVASPQLPNTEVRKSNLNTQDIYKLYHHYYPQTDEGSSRAASKDSLNVLARQYYPKHGHSEASPQLMMAPGDRDKFVTSRGDALSPAAVMETHCNKIQTRRSVSSPHIAISGHDQFVTDRKTLTQVSDLSQEQSSFGFQTSVEVHQQDSIPSNQPNIFQFNQEFDPGEPHKEVWPNNCQVAQYNPRNEAKQTPSKIPVRTPKGKSDQTPSASKKSSPTNSTINSSGKKQTSASKIPRLNSKSLLPPKPKPRNISPKETDVPGRNRNLVSSLKIISKS